MGCSSSKHFEKESLMEKWMSSSSSSCSAGFLSSCAMEDHPFQCYHHFVALTARSYGIHLRLLSPEAATEPPHKKKQSFAGGSLSELYDNLRSLESAVTTATTPPPQNAPSSSPLREFDCRRTRTIPPVDEQAGQEPTDEEDVKRVQLEVINVDEMMKGLEEAEAEQDCGSLQQQQQRKQVKESITLRVCYSMEQEMKSPESRSSGNFRRPCSRFSEAAEAAGMEAEKCTGSGRMKTEIDEKNMEKGQGNNSNNNKRKCAATNLVIPSWMGAAAMSSKRMAVGKGVPSPGPQSPLFDPDLIASYEAKLAADHLWEECWAEMECSAEKGLERKKWPPGGEEKLVMYTTTIGGIRKTFEDCNWVREILRSYRVSIDERDVSMHMEFLREVRELLFGGRMVAVKVPKVFVKGRYVGGKEEVMKLHEDGKLGGLLEGLEKKEEGEKCEGCDGVRFVPCLECRGSCKLLLQHIQAEEEEEEEEEDDGEQQQQQQQQQQGARRHITTFVRCPHCNENGLIQCPICC